MSENQKKILQMLAEGKLSVEEASRLLALINDGQSLGNTGTESAKEAKSVPKYLYVHVEPKPGHHCNAEQRGNPHSHGETGRVNVRIPVGLIRAGIKLKTLIPPQVADDVNKALNQKGMNFDIRDLKAEYLDELIVALGETEIAVDSEEAEVRIHAE